jgi:hypothetical protein
MNRRDERAATLDNGDGDDNDVKHFASEVANLVSEGSEGRLTRQQALAWLLHSPHGAALMQRLRTSKKGTADMNATVKIAKGIAETGMSWLTEEELTEKIFAHAQLDRLPHESPHQAFARVFSASTPEALLFRKAVAVAKTVDVRPPSSDDDDAAAAYAKLQRLAEQRRKREPGLSPEQAFAKVFSDPANRALADQAHQRPIAVW